MGHPDIVVIGGGIAGLSLSWNLARNGAGKILVIEKEAQLASHASGRNAAIWLPSSDDEAGLALAGLSAQLLDGLFDGHRHRWLTSIGAICPAKNELDLNAHHHGAKALGWQTEQLDYDQLISRLPSLKSGNWEYGVYLDQAGILDIDRICQSLARAARQAQVQFDLGHGVEKIQIEGDQVCGVITKDQRRIPCRSVAIAAGAWAGRLRPKAPLPFVPLRRHLVALDAPANACPHIVWSVGVSDEIYFRPESGGMLASPCDATLTEPGDCTPDPRMLELLARKLGDHAPSLARAGVRSFWACQRSFAPDRQLILGPDHQITGLYWLAGLGGRGMSIGVGAGHYGASMILSSPSDLDLNSTSIDLAANSASRQLCRQLNPQRLFESKSMSPE